MEKYLAVEGCVVTCDPATVVATVDMSSLKSTKGFIEGKAIYIDKLAITLSGNLGSGTITNPTQIYYISAKSTKVFLEEKPVLEVGDEETFPQVAWNNPSPASGFAPVTCTINNAGQSKVYEI